MTRETTPTKFKPSPKPLSPRSRPQTKALPDIPSIVERYISLVGKVIKDMDERASKKDGLKAHEVNSVAAIGRAVAMLQAVESASITRVGGKAVKEHTSEQLRRMLADAQAAEAPRARRSAPDGEPCEPREDSCSSPDDEPFSDPDPDDDQALDFLRDGPAGTAGTPEEET